jgi:hypothetical protein
MKWLRLRSPLVWLGVPLICGLLAIPAADLYYTSTRGEGCARCHEIRPNLVSWQGSSHREMNCTDCHTSTTQTNLRRVVTHFSGTAPDQISLRTSDVWSMEEKCISCHRQEYARWSSSTHSATYERIFANAEHNQKRQLIDDCLRCHGMHFDGSIHDVVEPLDTRGPWKIKDAALAGRPTIPCLSCHVTHREGMPLKKPSQRIGVREELFRPSLGLFDRRARMNMGTSLLHLPAMHDGERLVTMSPDPRQSLCYQCHAPLASGQLGSGDDRTPKGVHEGLSCLGCHEKHSQNTRQSCADCHPRLSNCGIDVEKMDTTFVNPTSKHNIHWVQCIDCHPAGIPKKKSEQTAGIAQ